VNEQVARADEMEIALAETKKEMEEKEAWMREEAEKLAAALEAKSAEDEKRILAEVSFFLILCLNNSDDSP